MSISRWLSALPDDCIKLLQITDCHIYGSSQESLLGVDTFASLQQTLAAAKECLWPVDAILLTGDIVHDNSDIGYARTAQLFDEQQLPVFCLPGNHDTHALFQKHFNTDYLSTEPFMSFKGWHIVMLDSVLPGKEHGFIDDEALSSLDKQLQSLPDTPTLVCLHHQPVDIASAWIDKIGLQNKHALWSVLDQHKQVKGVAWGHIHQQFDSNRNEVLLMATPSTCVQFKPETDNFSVDQQPAGCRWIALFPDGRIETKILRTDQLSSGLQTNSSGY